MIDTLSYCIDRKFEFESNLQKSIRSLETSNPVVSGYLENLRYEDHWKRLILSLDTNFTCKIQVRGNTKYVNSLYSPWSEAKRQLANMGELGRKPVVHYFGVGLGYHLALLLRDNPDLEKLFLYEYDPTWLVNAFSLHDFSPYLLSKSIKVFLSNVNESPSQILKKRGDFIWVNPVLGKVYDSHYSSILGRGVNTDLSEKDIGLIVSLHRDPSYRNLTSKVYNEMLNLGWSVNSCDNDYQKIRTQCFRSRPKFLFSVSFSPELSDISKKLRIPYVSWEFDKVMSCDFIRPDVLSPETYVFTTCGDDVLKFEYAGARAFYLAPISNIDCSHDLPSTEATLSQFECDISFVGSSLLNANNDFTLFKRNVHDVINRGNEEVRGEGIRLLEALQRALVRQMPYTLKNEYRLQEILIEELNSVYPLKFFKFNHIQLHNILAKECCKMQRINYLKHLRPLQVSVFGNSDWENISGSNLIYKGVADYDLDCKVIYKASKINVDITRIYQLDGFSDRVMNVLSYGGFLVMNRTQLVEKSFEIDKELVVFDTPEEFKEKCEYYLNADNERREIASRGMRRAATDHTIKKRVKEIFSRLPEKLRHSGQA